ncbi:MAG TPA: hypothetical protein VF263_12305 [Longimicrobiaceae bacterium]
MRIALAVLMLLHGVAHLPGFLVPWRLVEAGALPTGTTLLAGRVDVGGAGIRAFGVLWLLAAAAFLLAAFGAWTDRTWWVQATAAVALASLLMSVLAWPASRIGVAVNLVVLAWVAAIVRLGWT